MDIWITLRVLPIFLGVASQNRVPEEAGRRNSMEQLAVTQRPPLEQAQLPATTSASVARAPPWTFPWGLMELGPMTSSPRARPGSTWDAVFVGELVGLIECLYQTLGERIGVHRGASLV